MAVVGLGIDLCSIDRIKRIVGGPRGNRFVNRVFTEAEQVYCRGRADSESSFAARFAAKEALMKALGTPPGIRWREMEVSRGDGSLSFRLFGAAKAEVQKRGVRILLALSHDAGVAAAVVVLEAK